MILYSYFRSSASYRVRLGLALKGLSPEMRYVNLRTGEQREGEYLDVNPQGLVPALVLEDGTVLTQSLAILEYLEETHPTPPLLPADAAGRARVRSLAQTIACDMQPFGNLRTLNYLKEPLGHGEAVRQEWVHHWFGLGFSALETRLADAATGQFCHGDTPGLVDCFLIPQIFAALRFGYDMDAHPILARIYATATALPQFVAAAPQSQPDYAP